MRNGDYIKTFTGQKFYPLDPRAEEIDIDDIARSLSMQCRYSGHTERFYSVAEHSIHMSYKVSLENAMWALLHDATEAYLSDVPRPIKPFLGDFTLLEENIHMKIAHKFELAWPIPEEVHEADRRILEDEIVVLMKIDSDWDKYRQEPLGVKIACWSWDVAEYNFMRRFNQLNYEKYDNDWVG